MSEMSGPITLRLLRADEAAALCAFYNALGEPGIIHFCPLGPETTLEVCARVCRDVAEGKRYDLVLEQAGQIVGWAFLTRLDQPQALLGIGMKACCTGQGWGKRLMQDLTDQARKQGKSSIELTVDQINERAWRLYEKFGFVRTGEGVRQTGMAYFSMVLILEPS